MITTSDIGDIIYKDCKVFGIPVYRFGNIPEGVVKTDRITIYVKTLVPDDIWSSVFVNVNFCVPDIKGKADLKKLKTYEREARLKLDDVTKMYDGTRYVYTISSSGIEEDLALKCHFINIRLKFDVLNVK